VTKIKFKKDKTIALKSKILIILLASDCLWALLFSGTVDAIQSRTDTSKKRK